MRSASMVVALLAGLLVSGASGGESNRVVVICVDGLPGFMIDDPQAALPNIRRLARNGAQATEGMVVSNPAVTWPNHTTMMTGVHPAKHGVLFNGGIERLGPSLAVRVDPRRTQQDLVAVPMLFDYLHEQGKVSSAINWPCTRGSESIRDNFPDVPDMLEHSTPALVAELKERGILETEGKAGFMRQAALGRDVVWTDTACHLLKTRAPDLLVLHLLNVDSVHHKYGPNTMAGYAAVGGADGRVGQVIDAVEAAGLTDTTTFFIVSDHGFISIPKTIQPHVAFKKAGILKSVDDRIIASKAYCIPEGGIGMIYLTIPESAKEDAEVVRKALLGQEGVADVLGPDQFDKYHLPKPGDHPGMADLIVVAKEGYGIGASAAGDEFVTASTGTLGTHGFPSDYKAMNATFIASGAGIKRGTKVESVSNVDLTPTIGRLLGAKLPPLDGRVLSEILDSQP